MFNPSDEIQKANSIVCFESTTVRVEGGIEQKYLSRKGDLSVAGRD